MRLLYVKYKDIGNEYYKKEMNCHKHNDNSSVISNFYSNHNGNCYRFLEQEK